MRVNDTTLGATLRSYLDGAARDGEAPPNLTVLAGRAGGAARGKHLLYWRGRLALRTTDAVTLAAALRHHAALLRRAATAVELGAVPVLVGGGVVAVDQALRDTLWDAEPRLRHAGAEVVPAPTVPVGHAGAVMLGDRRLPLRGLVTPQPDATGAWWAQMAHADRHRRTVGGRLAAADLALVGRLTGQVAVRQVSRGDRRAMAAAVLGWPDQKSTSISGCDAQ